MADNLRKKDAGLASTSRGSVAECTSAMTSHDSALQPEKTVSVLAISPLEDDHLFLASIFSHTNWHLRKACTWREALGLLARQRIPVLICESQLVDADWKDVLAELSSLPDQPLLIVSSRLADESFWAEVLNLGAYDVLMKPFDATEVFRVVSLAWLSWKNDHERIAMRTPSEPEFARAVGL
jgi:DNA-binding NtrC family response regulator